MQNDESETAGSTGQERAMRELIALEERCAELRAELGLEHRVYPTAVSESAERAVHALVGQLATDFLSVHAADGTYLWASPSCERLFGWKPEALVGRSAYDLLHPDDLPRVAANHNQHVGHAGADPLEYRLLTADGTFRWVETHSANCKDPSGLPQIVCFTRDITARRERDEEVQTLLERYESQRKPAEAPDEAFLRVCAWCKAVGDEASRWTPIEVYLATMTERTITHGICPGCVATLRAR